MKTRYVDTVWHLLQGGSLVASGKNGFRVRDAAHRVYFKVSKAVFLQLKPLLRRSGGMYLINKNLVRQLHGNQMEKRLYKQLQEKRKPLPAESARA